MSLRVSPRNAPGRVVFPGALPGALEDPPAGAASIGHVGPSPFPEPPLLSRRWLSALPTPPRSAGPLLTQPGSAAPSPSPSSLVVRGSPSPLPYYPWPAAGGHTLPPRRGARPRFVSTPLPLPVAPFPRPLSSPWPTSPSPFGRLTSSCIRRCSRGRCSR